MKSQTLTAGRALQHTAAELTRGIGLALATAGLVACGGGGGGGGANPAPDPTTGYSLVGTIEVPAIAVMDGDVNDPNAEYRSNDSSATAQALDKPVTVSGYVNVAGAGAQGRLRTGGDAADFYRVDLVSGESVTVFVAEPGEGDVDVRLRDQAGTVVDASVNTDSVETVQAPSAGTYYVEVYPYSGASNYLMAVGQGAVFSVPGELRLAADFVAHEAVLQYRPEAAERMQARLATETAFSVEAGMPGEEQRVRLNGDDRAMARAYRGPDAGGALDFATPELGDKWATLMAIKALRADAAIEFAEPNYIVQVRPMYMPNDEYFGYQWHYPMINLPGAWNVTRGDPGVVVAVIDTGVLLNHPDLQGQLVSGFDFVSNPGYSLDGDGIDANPNDPGDQYPYGGSSFHGTHVAGTIAAASGNGTGVAGVAPQVRIMPIRVLGAGGSGTSYDIRQGIRFAGGLGNDSGRVPSRRADVINLSLGGPSSSDADQALFNELRSRGVIVVAAAGNEASSRPNYPASYEGVISVSAVGLNGQLASYSSFGSRVDVAAPGGDDGDRNGDGYVDGVLSTSADDSGGALRVTYRFLMGTSMASPHVAGVIALMKSVNRGLAPADVERLLAGGRLTREMGPAGRDDYYGYGLIDAALAVNAAQGGGTPPVTPAISANPATLQFAASQGAQELVLADNAGGTVRVLEITANVGWLQVSAVSTATTGLGRYRVTVNRGGLAPGSHQGAITIRSDANTLSIPVTLQVADVAATGGDAGVHYIALIDATTDATVMTATVTPNRGTYRYEIEGVPPGEYRIVAGSDPDNDDRICEAGEACGWYGGVDDPESITVDRSMSALDLTTEFQTDGRARGIATNDNGGGR